MESLSIFVFVFLLILGQMIAISLLSEDMSLLFLIFLICVISDFVCIVAIYIYIDKPDEIKNSNENTQIEISQSDKRLYSEKETNIALELKKIEIEKERLALEKERLELEKKKKATQSR